jgi:uncharacterized protein YndB with AHSA1/START domain
MDVDLDLSPLVFTVDVRCAPEAAFRYFTDDIGSWWPLGEFSVGGDTALTCSIEPRVGGAFVERTREGDVHRWGTVTAWEPPRLLAFTWHPGGAADTAQSVEVRFVATTTGTSVTLTHGGWSALGARGPAVRDEYRNGWGAVLGECFVQHVANASGGAR